MFSQLVGIDGHVAKGVADDPYVGVEVDLRLTTVRALTLDDQRREFFVWLAPLRSIGSTI
jgi:hypothetical protein